MAGLGIACGVECFAFEKLDSKSDLSLFSRLNSLLVSEFMLGTLCVANGPTEHSLPRLSPLHLKLRNHPMTSCTPSVYLFATLSERPPRLKNPNLINSVHQLRFHEYPYASQKTSHASTVFLW